MFPKKSAKPTKKAFTNEQIRARAYQIWEKNKEQSEEENWNAAIKALERERRFRVLTGFWRWTGLGEKKGWDIVTSLSIPLIVFGGGILFNYLNGKQQQEVAEQKQKDELLKTYINDMKGFLLDEKHSLKKSKENDEIRSIARTITLTTLAQLNSSQDEQRSKEGKYNQRKGLIMQFLFESGLIKFNSKVVPIISLSTADFAFANLQSANFQSANLNLANFQSANLIGAYLYNVQNLTSSQVKMACNWKEAIYSEAEFDENTFSWAAKDKTANQKKIDKIKQDKASDPATPPNCSMWK